MECLRAAVCCVRQEQYDYQAAVYMEFAPKEACLAYAPLTEGSALELRTICNGQHADFHWFFVESELSK